MVTKFFFFYLFQVIFLRVYCAEKHSMLVKKPLHEAGL